MNICCYYLENLGSSELFLYRGIMSHFGVTSLYACMPLCLRRSKKKAQCARPKFTPLFLLLSILNPFSNLKINLHNFLLQWVLRINYTFEKDRSSFDTNGTVEGKRGTCKFWSPPTTQIQTVSTVVQWDSLNLLYFMSCHPGPYLL